MDNEKLNIESYFEKFEKQFSEQEPDFGHFNRFSEKLDQLHRDFDQQAEESLGKAKQIPFYKLAVAASFILLCGLLSWNFLTESKHAEEFSSSQESQSNSAVSNASYNSPSKDEVMTDLERIHELEVQYLNLKYNYSKTNDSSLLNQLKANLDERTAIIEKLQAQSINVASNYNYNSFFYTNDCCGLESDYQGNSGQLYGKVNINY